jgi:diadenosine tetraphosphatase ApaH/serine/threonine PP2A family protein phosphatase
MDRKLLMESVHRNHIHRYVLKPWEPEDIRGLVRESVQNYYGKER